MGWQNKCASDPGACAPGFMLTPASQAKQNFSRKPYSTTLLDWLVAHRDLHGRKDLLADSLLPQFFQLRTSKIKLDGRLFDSANDGAFRKTCLHELDNGIIRERLRLFQLGWSSAAGFRGWFQDAHSGAAGRHRFSGSRSISTTASSLTFCSTARAKDAGAGVRSVTRVRTFGQL